MQNCCSPQPELPKFPAVLCHEPSGAASMGNWGLAALPCCSAQQNMGSLPQCKATAGWFDSSARRGGTSSTTSTSESWVPPLWVCLGHGAALSERDVGCCRVGTGPKGPMGRVGLWAVLCHVSPGAALPEGYGVFYGIEGTHCISYPPHTGFRTLSQWFQQCQSHCRPNSASRQQLQTRRIIQCFRLEKTSKTIQFQWAGLNKPHG